MNEEKAGFGLSMLADAVTPDHYPVKKRGERRRLNPNRAGIAHLEETTRSATEITNVVDTATAEGEWYSLLVSYGWTEAKTRGNYARPMMEALPAAASSTMQVRVADPCPVCDDFAYTGRYCPGHPEAVPPRNLTVVDFRPRTDPRSVLRALLNNNVEVSWRTERS